MSRYTVSITDNDLGRSCEIKMTSEELFGLRGQELFEVGVKSMPEWQDLQDAKLKALKKKYGLE